MLSLEKMSILVLCPFIVVLFLVWLLCYVCVLLLSCVDINFLPDRWLANVFSYR